MIRAFILATGLLVAALSPAATRAGEAVQCQAPPEIVEDDPRMPLLAHQLKAGQPVTIVAIGGASTAGTAAGADEANAYPHRLEEALRRHHPGAKITVLNKGVPRQSAQDMIQRFNKDVYSNHPTLVVWEVGTVETVRGYDIDAFIGTLHEGIAALRDHNADVMLVDMQYSRSTASVINYEPYLDAMRRTADIEDVYLFRRYEIMKYWSEAGVFDFAEVPKDQRAAFATVVYKCLGERLADAIDYATE